MASPRSSEEATQSAIRTVDELLAGMGLQHANRAGSSAKKLRPATSENGADHAHANHKNVEVLRVEAWAKLRWLYHGFSTRRGGTSTVYRASGDHADAHKEADLNLGYTANDDARNVAENRRIFLEAVVGREISQARPRLVVLKQIHSSLILRVGNPNDVPVQASGDGMMTNEPGVMLGILTADCIPILIADRKKRAVAAFHAGWRGTLKRIVETGVGSMRLAFGSRPEDLVAAIGPGIGSCCYAIGEEIRHEFESQFAYASILFREVSDADPVKQKYPMLFMTARAPGHSGVGPSLHLDLAEANRRQLLDAGLKPKRIAMLSACTSCNPMQFFSHRAQQGFTGRMMAAVGIRE